MIVNGKRLLDANEIEVRLGNKLGDKGFNALLYKDARTDMKLLDEKYTQYGWQKDYKTIDGKLFCGIGIFNKDIGQWVWKWDVGTESNMEAEKGEASDAFKRAGFNMDVGRELYTAPQIAIWDSDKNKRYKVTSIGYNDSWEINQLEIAEVKTGNVVFSFGSSSKPNKPEPKKEQKKKEEHKKQEPVKEDAIAPIEARKKVWVLMLCAYGMQKGNEESKEIAVGYAKRFLKSSCGIDSAEGLTNSMVVFLNDKFSKPITKEDFIE